MGSQNNAVGISRAGLGLVPLLLTVSAAAAAQAPSPDAPAATTVESTAVSPAGAEPASPITLEAVVVTAQKREEKLQNVPIAVTAFNSKQLETRGIENIGDLNALAPGLQVSMTPTNATAAQLTIRGEAQINPAIYWDPAVGIYLDGVYIGKAQGSVFDVVDLNRVEVLRGPQGTLYGRNTVAGAINLISRAPTGVFDGSASLEVGNYNALVQKLSVDLPKVGIVSASFGARSEQRDGWVETTRTSSVRELNDRRNNGYRLALHFDFSRDVLGDYRYDHSNVDDNGPNSQLYRADASFPPFGSGSPFETLPSFASRDRQKHADIDAPRFERSVVSGHSFTLAWKFDEHNTLKSISGYRKLNFSDSEDLDGSPLPIVFTQRFTDYDSYSEDLQLLGSAGPWTYVGGLYYFSDDGKTNNPLSFFGSGLDSRYGTKTDAYAAYGQVDYKPIDPLTLTAGLRYTSEKKELDRSFGFVGAPPPKFIPDGTNASKTFDDVTPLLTVAYKLNQDVNLYARYAEGFKSGGFNGEFSQLPTGMETQQQYADLVALNIRETKTPFQPEKQRSFELGAKTNLGKRAQLNLALFENKITDLQESIFVGTSAASVIRNAGKATVRGVELEGVFVPMAGSQLRANYAYLDPKYDKFIDGVDANGNPQNVADNRAFVHAPRNTFNLVADAELAKTRWGNVRALADYAWTGSFYTYPYQLSGPGEPGFNPAAQVAGDTKVRSYGLLNLRLALSSIPLDKVGKGELALWCRNATDEKVAANFIDFGPGFGGLTDAYFIDPMTFGVTATVRW